jgi:hypothetical protein
MKKQLPFALAVLTCVLAALPLCAEVIRCDGVLGNSGEQGASLVRFEGSKPAFGLGVVADRYGTLWDRAGLGRLNRYAADGRFLAGYRIPKERSVLNDAMTAVGDTLILCLDGGLHTLSIDAPPDSSSTPMKIDADRMSLSSHDGWVAASKGPAVFLVNAAGDKKPVVTLQREPHYLEIGPDGTVYVLQDGKVYRADAGDPAGQVAVGSSPGDRVCFLAGFVYGSAWHSTLRRFDSAWQPAPGVVLGGNSGSFIGHVDEQAEVVSPRGMAKLGPDLFAISGFHGILHLLQWREQEKRLMPLRRIGSVPTCSALALDREGRTWWRSGNWSWSDGPAAPLHYGIPEAENIFALTMQESDGLVGYAWMWGKPTILFGKLDKEIRAHRIESPSILPREDAVAAAVVEHNRRRELLVLQRKGNVTVVSISDTGEYQRDIGKAQFRTEVPVNAWTSLAATGPDTLVAAGDSCVIELARDGENWKETRRWKSWGSDQENDGFDDPIWLSVDAGRLWVSDSEKHRVICFDLASRRKLAAFSFPEFKGDDLRSMNAPSVISARGRRAVVFDSGNQRLIKLRITND